MHKNVQIYLYGPCITGFILFYFIFLSKNGSAPIKVIIIIFFQIGCPTLINDTFKNSCYDQVWNNG